MADISEWFKSLPLFTRYWFALSIALPLIGRFRLINPWYFLLQYEPFIWNFQFWRPVTAVFFYPITPNTGFHYLANLYFLYNYSLRLETGLFSGKPADYGFLLLFTWACSVIVGLLVELVLLMDTMVMCVIYIWCQVNKDTIVSFWFGTQFKAMYLPWVVTVFEFVLSGTFLPHLIGIFIGHLYFFLKFKYPVDFGGPALLETPHFLYNYFPNQRQIGGFGQVPTARRNTNDNDGAPAAGRGHQWGRGNTLGN